MGRSEERGQANGVGVLAPGQGFAYPQIVPGQMQMYMPPQVSYKSGHNLSVEDLSNALGSYKPFHSGITQGMATMPYGDGRSFYNSRGSTQHLHHPQQYMMPPHLMHFPHLPQNAGPFAWNGLIQENQEMPTLARRNSASSHEEIGPQTPFMPSQYSVDQPKKTAGFQLESPQIWSISSPSSMTYGTSMPQQLWKSDGEYKSADYESLCRQNPAIPPPVPAIFSNDKSRGTLDKCLKNDTNTTNVYIRGLHPNTSDEMLEAYGARFGNIMSAKSMLDQSNGSCKGFGFIKYHNFDDGENCIRGFFHLGYEAKWARVSHNERLKTLADENNTNLYISNLPMSFNEQMLMSVFSGYEVLSSKILRDDNGISRGVGFARFSNPVVCSEIINKYNGHQVIEGYNLSIRFADTPDQKKLKSLTAERRQFKTHEYNTAAYGPGSPYTNQLSPVPNQFPSPLQGKFPSPLSQVQPAIITSYYPSADNQPKAASWSSKKLSDRPRVTGPAAHNTAMKVESSDLAAHVNRTVRSQGNERSDHRAGMDDDRETTIPLENVTNAYPRGDVKRSPANSSEKKSSPSRRSVDAGLNHVTPSKAPGGKAQGSK